MSAGTERCTSSPLEVIRSNAILCDGSGPPSPTPGDDHLAVSIEKLGAHHQRGLPRRHRGRHIEVMTDDLRPKDHAESVALFRAQVLGPVLCGELERGALAKALRALSRERVRPPGSAVTRTYAVPTLQRWYYRYRRFGLEGLRPASRRTGSAQTLSERQRELIVAIRREYPSASVPLILRTLEGEGHVAKDAVKASAIRRLLTEHGLDRRTLARSGKRERRRWQAAHPGRLWHADVCHGPSLTHGPSTKPLRIHGVLDDASRYVVALAARHSEREADMLDLLAQAIRAHGKPEGLYLEYVAGHIFEVLFPISICGRGRRGLLLSTPTAVPPAARHIIPRPPDDHPCTARNEGRKEIIMLEHYFTYAEIGFVPKRRPSKPANHQ